MSTRVPSNPGPSGQVTRRAVVAGLGVAALASSSAAALAVPAIGDDAELIRLGTELARLEATISAIRADEAPAHAALAALEAELIAAHGENYFFIAPANTAWRERSRQLGLDASGERQMAVHDEAIKIADQMREIPATTPAGLMVKARAFRFDCNMGPAYADEDDEDEAREVTGGMLQAFLAEIERVVGAPDGGRAT